MDIQRLRNLTTGRLHTEIKHVYKDIALITGESGWMTHQLPNACSAIRPYLHEKVTDARFWDGNFDPNHTGDIDIPQMDAAAQNAMWERYGAMPSLLANTADPVQTGVLDAVVAERARQDGKWGGAQADDGKTPTDWCLDIEAYNTWACQMHRSGSPDKYRRRMLQIAALAVAACESFDRKAAK